MKRKKEDYINGKDNSENEVYLDINTSLKGYIIIY